MTKVRGFTLLELIVVMVLMGILAGSFTVFFKPALDAFFDARRRADMTDAADTALRKMAQDVRSAVPNSLNVIDATTTDSNSACFQIVPVFGGGAYRTDIDTADSAAVVLNDLSTSPFRMAILSFSWGRSPAVGDYVVINNQNGDDVYDSGLSRARIDAITLSDISPLTLYANPTDSGYMGGRFQLVAGNERSIMYTCANNTLTRKVFSADFAKKSACDTDGVLVAGNVSGCTFTYSSASASPTETHGLLTMTLVLTHAPTGESISLGYAIHVDNTP